MFIHTPESTAYLFALIGPTGPGGLDVLDARIFSSYTSVITPAPRGTVQVELFRTSASDYGTAKNRILDMIAAGYGPWPPSWKLEYFLRYDIATMRGAEAVRELALKEWALDRAIESRHK